VVPKIFVDDNSCTYATLYGDNKTSTGGCYLYHILLYKTWASNCMMGDIRTFFYRVKFTKMSRFRSFFE